MRVGLPEPLLSRGCRSHRTCRSAMQPPPLFSRCSARSLLRTTTHATEQSRLSTPSRRAAQRLFSMGSYRSAQRVPCISPSGCLLSGIGLIERTAFRRVIDTRVELQPLKNANKTPGRLLLSYQIRLLVAHIITNSTHPNEQLAPHTTINFMRILCCTHGAMHACAATVRDGGGAGMSGCVLCLVRMGCPVEKICQQCLCITPGYLKSDWWSWGYENDENRVAINTSTHVPLCSVSRDMHTW